MRYSFLVFLAIFSLQLCAQDNSAFRGSKAENQDYVAVLSAPNAEAFALNQDQFEFDTGQVRPRARRRGDLGTALGAGDQCFTIHSILVRQPRWDADQVQQSGHRTCTKASMFKLKNAEPDMK